MVFETESETGHSEMLPNIIIKHHEEMLGSESWETTGDGGSREDAWRCRYFQRRGNDPRRSETWLFLFCLRSWSLNLPFHPSPLYLSHWILEQCSVFFFFDLSRFFKKVFIVIKNNIYFLSLWILILAFAFNIQMEISNNIFS